jgi:hypothetical protein
MTSEAVCFDLHAAKSFLHGYPINPDWWANFPLNIADRGISTHEIEGIAYSLSDQAAIETPLIIIKLTGGKLFDIFDTEQKKLEALTRTLKAAVLIFDHGGRLPTYWRPFSGGEYLTFQSNNRSSGENKRIAVYRRLGDQNYAYAFDVTQRQSDYDHLMPDFKLLEKVFKNYPDALDLPKSVDRARQLSTGVFELDEDVRTVVLESRLEIVYNTHLTSEQRRFVDCPAEQAIRLKGAAGTGKTLAMVVKLLREAAQRMEKGFGYRLLYLTHNVSASDSVKSYSEAIDDRGVINNQSDEHLVRIDTLFGLAAEQLTFELEGVSPVSYDGYEGKKLQLYLVESIVDRYRRSRWITKRGKVSEEFASRFETPRDGVDFQLLCWDILNEIACVLDADGVRDSHTRRERYLRQRRSNMVMKLDGAEDRGVILDIYDLYRKELLEQNMISVDQLVADYLGFLDSYRWELRRKKQGYDVIFVDEYHLFNSLEKSVFPSLIRDSACPLPPIIMALDPRQSPRYTFLDFGTDDADFGRATTRAQAKIEFRFNDIFRYTPEILSLLHYVNQSFPAEDLGDEWLGSDAASRAPSGPKPEAIEALNREQQYDKAIHLAKNHLRRGSKGRDVAILVMTFEAFETVSKAGKYADDVFVIDGRDALNKLRYAGRRVILSMPEFVAGAQFDHVIVTDVNEREENEDRKRAMIKRRFVSNLYLAVSRARRGVIVLGHRELGGLAQVIRRAGNEGIVEVKGIE